jgi:hypothetical protein
MLAPYAQKVLATSSTSSGGARRTRSFATTFPAPSANRRCAGSAPNISGTLNLTRPPTPKLSLPHARVCSPVSCSRGNRRAPSASGTSRIHTDYPQGTKSGEHELSAHSQRHLQSLTQVAAGRRPGLQAGGSGCAPAPYPRVDHLGKWPGRGHDPHGHPIGPAVHHVQSGVAH